MMCARFVLPEPIGHTSLRIVDKIILAFGPPLAENLMTEF